MTEPSRTSPPAPPSGAEAHSPLGIAVVGLGKMGVMHAAMVSAVPGARVAALVDADRGAGSQLQSMGAQAPFFRSLDEMAGRMSLGADRGEVQAAIIATPSFTHRAAAVSCLERGLHVLCEKPLAHTLEDAQAMARAAADHPGRVTAVGFMKGHAPLWLEAARRIRSGWIGAPRRFHAAVFLSQVLGPRHGWTFTQEKSGGGILINSGIHLVHLLRLLFGDVGRVTCLARPMHSAVEDTLAALIEFRSGVFGSYDASWSVPGYPTEGTTLLVEGDAGTLEITDDWLRTHHLTGGGEAPRGWSATHRGELAPAAFNLSPDYYGEGYYGQIEDFVRAIREGARARYDWQEGLRVQEIVDAMYRSAQTRQAVALDQGGG